MTEWTGAERKRAFDLRAEGKSNREIDGLLGRARNSTEKMFSREKKKGRAIPTLQRELAGPYQTMRIYGLRKDVDLFQKCAAESSESFSAWALKGLRILAEDQMRESESQSPKLEAAE